MQRKVGLDESWNSYWLPFIVGDCTTYPAALTHNTAVHLLIHLSRSCVAAVCVCAWVSASVHVPACGVCETETAYTLNEVSVPGQIGEGTELKRMRKIPADLLFMQQLC